MLLLARKVEVLHLALLLLRAAVPEQIIGLTEEMAVLVAVLVEVCLLEQVDLAIRQAHLRLKVAMAEMEAAMHRFTVLEEAEELQQ